MAGKQSAQDDDATRNVGEPSEGSGPRRTPEESTAGLASVAAGGIDAGESDAAPLQPGETLAGRFSVVRFIARGGMGAVYEAKDNVLRTRVALKLVRRRIARDGTAMEHLRREALLARQVSHPNVCRVYELYEATTRSGEPIHFLTMELLPGETLARKLAREGALSTVQALPLVQQMCAGLAAAHAEGVIHRDFKSANVMLVPRADASGASTFPPRVAITDFGVAGAVSGFLGTPASMAPEQVTGGEMTPATDIHALGIVLFEMVTGKLPFAGDTELAAPGLDPRWSKAIARCLAREPNRRFPSALEVLDVLGAPRRPGRRNLALGGLAAVLLLGAFAGLWSLPRLHREKASVSTVPVARPVAAILGVANRLPEKRLAWLSTAAEEGLHHELAAAETSMRVLSTNRVAKARRSLGIGEDALSELKSRGRLQSLLVANRLIHGELAPAGPDSGAVHLALHLLDGPTGQELAAFSEDLGPDAAKLIEALQRLGAELREALNAQLSPEEASVLASTRVKSLDAAEAHAEGVSSLRASDFAQARGFFDAALASDPMLVDARRRIVESWQRQGFKKAAREAAERLATEEHLLTSRQVEEFAATALRLGSDVQKGLEARLALFNARPDDEDLGFDVAIDNVPPRKELALVRRLRQLPPPLSEDLRLDAVEAEAVWGDDPERAHALLDRLQRRARELGARSEEALANWVRASLLLGPELREVAPYREAVRLYSEAGDAESAAAVMGDLANALAQHGSTRDALTALDEAAGAFRRLGNRWRLHVLLSLSALDWWALGNGELAWKRLEEARREAEILGEAPSDAYLWIRPKLLCWDADLAGCRAAVQTWRGSRGPDNPFVMGFEAQILEQQDQLEEARGSMKRAALLLEKGGANQGSGIKLAICKIECEQGRAAEGLACLTKVPLTPPRSEDRHLVEARCKYLSGDFSGAEEAARSALTDSVQDFIERIPVKVEIARTMAANGQRAKAISDLRKTLAEIESKGFYRLYAFEAALALGEAELAAGMPNGRFRLVRLEREAKEREHFRIARLAREALDRNRLGKQD